MTAPKSTVRARRDQAVADIEALDVQVSTGEIDAPTAARLRRAYEADLADALAELDEPEGGTGEEDGDGGDRRWRWGVAAATAVAGVAVLAFLAAGPRGEGDLVTGGAPEAPAVTDTTRDLSTVTDAELEEVIEQNPDVVAMRLALVERYLAGGNFADARRHAEEAAVRATSFGDRARALRYLGWTTALLGDPVQGEGLVVQSLAFEPDNPNSLYFLARIRFELLGRPDLALEPLEQLTLMEMSDEQRALIDGLLADVRAAVETGTTTATTAP